MLFSHFIWVDYTILVLILLAIVWCYRKGFVNSTLSLICWVVALSASFKFAEPVGGIFENVIHSEQVRTIAGFFIIFIILALVGVLILYLFNHMIEKGALHKTDKVIGGFSGIIVGIFFIAALLLVGRYSTLTTKPFWTKSFLIPYFQPFEDVINSLLPASVQGERDLLPDDLEKKIEKTLEDAKEDIKEGVEDRIENISDETKKKTEAVTDSVQNSTEQTIDNAGKAVGID